MDTQTSRRQSRTMINEEGDVHKKEIKRDRKI